MASLNPLLESSHKHDKMNTATRVLVMLENSLGRSSSRCQIRALSFDSRKRNIVPRNTTDIKPATHPTARPSKRRLKAEPMISFVIKECMHPKNANEVPIMDSLTRC